jgi:hypothetical protein
MAEQSEGLEGDAEASVMLTIGGIGAKELVANRERLILLRQMLGGAGMTLMVLRLTNHETLPSSDYTDMSGLSIEEILGLHHDIFDVLETDESKTAEEYEAVAHPFIIGLGVLPRQDPAKAVELFERLTGDESTPKQRYMAAITIDALPIADPTAALRIWERLLRDPTTDPEEPHLYARGSIEDGLDDGTISLWQAFYLRRIHNQAHPEA